MNSVYLQLVVEIEKDIEAGIYKQGKRLPSVRELCERYGCSSGTAVKAYENLRSRHMVYSVPQSGYYLVEKSFPGEADERNYIDFSTGNLIMDNMSIPDLKHCLDRAVELHKYNYSRCSLYGANSLREILPQYLSDFQIFVPVSNIFINLGVQHALTILTEMPFPNGKETILVEQPSYRMYMEYLSNAGKHRVLGIERGGNGIDLNRLETLFRNESIKFFYTIPRNHNPLGTAYNTVQRKAIARLAEKYDVYIVEDDYFGDVLPAAHYDPIFSYGDHRHHIYVKNFSKIIPWIRIGLTILPDQLVKAFECRMQQSYYSSYFTASLISQATLEIYLRSNLLKKHTDIMGKELSGRQKQLGGYLKKLEPYGIRCFGGKSGFYFYLELPEHIDEKKLQQDLYNRGVKVLGAAEHYLESFPHRKGLRLSLARTGREDIEKGFCCILEELDRNY